MSGIKEISFEIKGKSPTMQHNGRLANPMDIFSQEIKRISSNTKKTEKDYQEIAELEWLGCLYCTEPIEFERSEGEGNRSFIVQCEGFPCIPGEILEAALIKSAKANRLGEKFKYAIACEGTFPLKSKYIKTVGEMFYDDRFFDYRMVCIKKNRVPRCRPIFNDWALSFSVKYRPEEIDEQPIVDAVINLGLNIGLSDNRPRYGRFSTEKVNGIDLAEWSKNSNPTMKRKKK